MPAGTSSAREQLEIRPRRERLDEVVHVRGFHRVQSSWGQDHGPDRLGSLLRATTPADDAHLVRLPDGVAHAEQWSAVFADLHPDDFGCVPEAPRLHHLYGDRKSTRL